jgi:uncharacterized protein (DUF2147 family)
LKHDKNNVEPRLRQRPLCGLTILSGLHSESPGRWADGQFYNPDDGTTYDVNLELTSADLITARIYQGVPLLGKTKTLSRVPRETSEGWC